MDHPELSSIRKTVREFLRASEMLLNMTPGDAPLREAELQLVRSYIALMAVKFAV